MQSTSFPLTGRAIPDWVLGQELTSRGVVLVTAALLTGSAWVNVGLGGQLGPFFALSFVLVCLTGALGAHDRSLFLAGVLPPLALVVVVLGVAVLSPEAVAADTVSGSTGLVPRTVAGVVGLAAPLVLGHLMALFVVAVRVTHRLRAES